MKKHLFILFFLTTGCAWLHAQTSVTCTVNLPPKQGISLCQQFVSACSNTANTIVISNPRTYPQTSPPLYEILLRYDDGNGSNNCIEHLLSNCSINSDAANNQITITLPGGAVLNPGAIDGNPFVWINIRAMGATTWQYFIHFYNGPCDFVLPLTLVSFEARNITGNKTELKWTTASESNTSHFEIQASMNGCIFQTVGQVPAAGNSSGNLNYTHTHTYPYRIDASKDATQYRLKMVDLDGRFTYSLIRLVRCNTCPQPPAQPCASQSIQGPAGFCNDNVQQFPIANANYTTFATWAANPAASVTLAGSGCYANVQRTTASGGVTLTAQVLGCPSALTKTLTLSDPPLYVNTSNSLDPRGHLRHTAEVVIYPGTSGAQYSWYRNGVANGTGYSRTFLVLPTNSIYYRVVYNGACGQQQYIDSVFGEEARMQVQVSPVPARDLLQVKLQKPHGATAAIPVTISIYDMQGNLKKQVKTAGATITIPVHSLRGGNYLLRVATGEKNTTRQITIEH